jgi:hypothetical protein
MNIKKIIGIFLATVFIFALTLTAAAKLTTMTFDESKAGIMHLSKYTANNVYQSKTHEISDGMTVTRKISADITEPSIFEILSPYIGLLFGYILWITAFIALIHLSDVC